MSPLDTSPTSEESVQHRTSFFTPPHVIPKKAFTVYADEDHANIVDSFDEWEDYKNAARCGTDTAYSPTTIYY